MIKNTILFLLIILLSIVGIQWMGWFGFIPPIYLLAILSGKSTNLKIQLSASATLLLLLLQFLFYGVNYGWHWSSMMGKVFQISTPSLFFLVHAVIATFLASLSAWAGGCMREVFFSKR